jgi:ribosomal-protein-alanine N-acetyltransferase
MLPDTLETVRLRLRPFRLPDVDDVFVYATDPEWARYLPVPQPYTPADAETFIAGQVLLDREVHPAWAIVRARAVIGGINLRFHFDHRVGEMGYSIARRYWGQGLATEAARAVMAAAFAAYPSLHRIRAMADARNIGSLRVMEKLGMIREGVLRQNRLVRGEFIDEVWCGVLRPEWEAQNAGWSADASETDRK